MARMLFSIAVTAVGLLAMILPQSSQLQAPVMSVSEEPVADAALLHRLQERYRRLSKKLSHLAPHETYILVDTARNRLYVKRRSEVLLDALASTGSGTMLDKPGDSHAQWVFDTPRGEFVVQSKLTHPVWVKPDWAFIEEGLAVPQNQSERVEPGVLGEYALGFGKGYFIHGTLYTRLLGKSVTHGCIRLNDHDLETVYQLARVGTPILIF
jgi:L,D-transpeptidase YbiS